MLRCCIIIGSKGNIDNRKGVTSVMELDKRTIHTIAVLLAFAIVLYLGLSNWNVVTGILGYVYNLIFPFILGGCIAFLLNIPMSFLTGKLSSVRGNGIGSFIRRGSRVISLILSCLIVIGIMAFVSYIVIPQLLDIFKVLPSTMDKSLRALKKWGEDKGMSSAIIGWINTMQIDWKSIFNNWKSAAFSGAGSVVLSTIGFATSLANSILNFSLGFVFALYILLQKDKLGTQCKKVLYAFVSEERTSSILEVTSLTSRTFYNFITGQCLDAAILGLMFFVSMLIFRFPYSVSISVIIACTALIPIVGSFIGCVIGILFIVMVDPVKAGLFLVLFIVLQQIEGNIVYPKVVGGSLGLPAIWVLVAITIGGKLMGVAGMIIFIPLFSIAYVLFRRIVYERLKEKKLVIK